MNKKNEFTFRDAYISIVEAIRNFDDEVFGEEEEAKEDLRNICQELLYLYKR